MNDLTKRRALAWIIDMLASALVLYIIGHMTPIRLHVAGWLSLSTSLQCTYLVCRDCFAGASPGRRLMNIRVADEHTGLMPSLRDCIVRNLVLLCISPVEAIVLLFSTDGKRLGDRLCHTRVTSLDVLPRTPTLASGKPDSSGLRPDTGHHHRRTDAARHHVAARCNDLEDEILIKELCLE